MSRFTRFARHKFSAARHLKLFCTPGSDTGDGCEEGNDVNVDIDVDGDDDVDVDCDDDNGDEGKRLLCVICPSHCEEDELVSSD